MVHSIHMKLLKSSLIWILVLIISGSTVYGVLGIDPTVGLSTPSKGAPRSLSE